MDTKHYYLMAAQVVYSVDGNNGMVNLNVIIVSDEMMVTRAQLGRAQQQAQVRFFKEYDTEQKSKVSDVFILSISHLGEMTAKDFHGEHYEEPATALPEASETPAIGDNPVPTTGDNPIE